MVIIQMIRYSGISNGDYHKKCVVRSNGVVENFALGVDKATFIPLEGKDFMDPQYLSEEVDHPGSHIQMVKALFIPSKVLQILSLQVLNLVQKKMGIPLMKIKILLD